MNEELCKCGKNAEKPPHLCPFSDEINHNDDPNYCTCCDDCRHQCAMDI